jgi:hypothetical protein
MYHTGICLEGMRKTTKNLSQDSRSLDRDLNQGPPEYEVCVLSTQVRKGSMKGRERIIIKYDRNHSPLNFIGLYTLGDTK